MTSWFPVICSYWEVLALSMNPCWLENPCLRWKKPLKMWRTKKDISAKKKWESSTFCTEEQKSSNIRPRPKRWPDWELKITDVWLMSWELDSILHKESCWGRFYSEWGELRPIIWRLSSSSCSCWCSPSPRLLMSGLKAPKIRIGTDTNCSWNAPWFWRRSSHQNCPSNYHWLLIPHWYHWRGYSSIARSHSGKCMDCNDEQILQKQH